MKNLEGLWGVNHEAVWNRLKEFYNGYNFSTQCLTPIYNPYAIVECLNSSKLKHHWSESGGLSTIKLAQVFKKLAETKRVHNNFAVAEEPDNTIIEYRNPDMTLTLWNYGYLTIKSYHDGFYELNSPNQETLKALNYIKMAILQSKVEIQEKYIEANLIRNLLRDKIEEFAKICAYIVISKVSVRK